MKKIVAHLSLFAILLLPVQASVAEGFSLISPEFSGQLGQAQVFNSFGCQGENISPALQWKNAPEGTKSFAITVYDSDAPTGSGWWHWVVFNLPAERQSLAKGASAFLPKGAVQSINSYGTYDFGGACPPKGDKPHRYILTVHALDIEKLSLPASTNPETIGFFLHQHHLARASAVAYYGR